MSDMGAVSPGLETLRGYLDRRGAVGSRLPKLFVHRPLAAAHELARAAAVRALAAQRVPVCGTRGVTASAGESEHDAIYT
jgi:hypothetical protein